MHRLLSLLFLATFAVPAAAQDVVANPETPRDGVVDIEPEFLWQRGDDTDDIFFGVVPRIVADEASGEIYVLDAQLHEIHVFRASSATPATCTGPRMARSG